MFLSNAILTVQGFVGEEAAHRAALVAGSSRWLEFFAYPLSSYLRVLWASVDLLEPKVGGVERAFEVLGQGAFENFLSTGVGKTLLTLSGNSPRRFLSNVPSALRTVVSYGERSVEWRSDRQATLRMHGEFLRPAYYVGGLRFALEAVGARQVHLSGRPLGPLDAEFSIRWE
jgi:uncharacterized protein (TIGR02265 family)